MKRPKVHPDCKTNYKIRNWASYDRALVRRGDLTICLSPRAVTTWTAMPSGKSGGQRYDTDIAIEAALTVRLVFGLPWRQAEGLLNVMLTFKDLEVRSPDHTTLSRRCRALDVVILVEPDGESLHVILEATGLQVFVLGEWASAKQGAGPKGPGWPKFHLAVDAKGNILAARLTDSEVSDASASTGAGRK